jgi:predicted deacylase
MAVTPEFRDIVVGTAKAQPGALSRGELVLGEFPDAPIASPVMIASGREPGPVLWVQGCVHGAEVGGAVAIHRCLRELDLASRRGAIIGVMLANPNAFRGYARNTPIDGENLNRVFPGSPAGGHTQQAAHALMQAALKVADAMLDLHSGGDRSIVPFYALYRHDGSEASRTAARLARAAATPDIWASTDAWLNGAMFTNMTARTGADRRMRRRWASSGGACPQLHCIYPGHSPGHGDAARVAARAAKISCGGRRPVGL